MAYTYRVHRYAAWNCNLAHFKGPVGDLWVRPDLGLLSHVGSLRGRLGKIFEHIHCCPGQKRLLLRPSYTGLQFPGIAYTNWYMQHKSTELNMLTSI